MATQVRQVVSGDDSDIHDEPHIQGSRVTVQLIHSRVEERGLEPETVARRYDLPVSAVYRALAYYHEHPEEMREAERQREEAKELAQEKSTMTPPES